MEELFEEVMIEIGASITITTLTNVLAFVIGAFTPTPEIFIFSLGNATAITIDYIYEWTVFGATMAIVGKWELDEVNGNAGGGSSADSGCHSIEINCSRSSEMAKPGFSLSYKFQRSVSSMGSRLDIDTGFHEFIFFQICGVVLPAADQRCVRFRGDRAARRIYVRLHLWRAQHEG